MAEPNIARDLALQTLKSPPPVASKLAALDALDRLALNPSGWFSDSVLDQLTEGRKAIITDRWGRALETLENTRGSMESFVGTLRGAAEAAGAPAERKAALERAMQEIQQLALVLGWLDSRPQG
jgi:ABC-type transporter Mla subunit MlaD